MPYKYYFFEMLPLFLAIDTFLSSIQATASDFSMVESNTQEILAKLVFRMSSPPINMSLREGQFMMKLSPLGLGFF